MKNIYFEFLIGGFFMHKKLFISFAILISLIFSFTICFANDGGNMVKDAADNVRNAVGGVENTVENVANNVGYLCILTIFSNNL